MRAAKTPSPNTALNSTVFPVIPIIDPPSLVVTKVGVVEALEVAEPEIEEAFELELGVPPATDELPEFCDEAVLDEATEEEPEGDVGAGAEEDGVVDEASGVVALLELELEPSPSPAGTTTPPCTLPTDCDDEVPAALAL